MDLYSRKIIGWAMSDRLKESLVINSLKMALFRRKVKSGLLLHSDRGSQYAADNFQQLLCDNNIKCSMSRNTEKKYRDKDVLLVMQKVYCITSKEIDQLFPTIWAAKAEITMQDGKKYKKTILYPRGTMQNPPTWQQIEDKFRDNPNGIITQVAQNDIIKLVKHLEQHSVRELLQNITSGLIGPVAKK